jgi:hypothetical protein
MRALERVTRSGLETRPGRDNLPIKILEMLIHDELFSFNCSLRVGYAGLSERQGTKLGEGYYGVYRQASGYARLKK